MRLLAALLLAGSVLAADPVPTVLMPIADGFNTTEFYPMWHGLQAAGYRVVVAAPAAGRLEAGEMSFPDAVALDPGQAGAFALAIGGGKGPARLEELPLAVELVRGFVSAGKPVSAICHGPRLLAKAGAMAGRVGTAWHEVRDETPDRWRDGAYGAYVDQPVVRDGSILTSRYPEDVTPWLRATLEHFAAAGGLTVEPAGRRILVLNPAVPGQTQNAILRTLPALLPEVRVVREWQLAEVLKEGDLGKAYDAAVLLDGARTAQMSGNAMLAAIVGQLAAAKRPILAQPGMAAAIGGVAGETLPPSPDPAANQALLNLLYARLRQIPLRTAEAAPARPQAYLALKPGFDDAVVATLRAVLDARGFQVTAVAATTGWQRGLHGLPVLAGATYAVPPAGPGAVVIAPGGFAPGGADAQRSAWLTAAYAGGAMLVTVGSDTWAVGCDPAFAGLRVAGSHQFRWSYAKEGARHADDAALRSAERLVTIQGADQLGSGLRILEPLLIR